jgi:hypothetical protein
MMCCWSPTDPPSQPIIHGYTEATSIAVGTVQKISCISSGGNPLATLTWYKNDKKVSIALFHIITICTCSLTYSLHSYFFLYQVASFGLAISSLPY